MSLNPTFKSLRLRNLLSFGSDSEPTELGPLNVLIGPNGSGKTNFIEAIGLLRNIPGDLAASISHGGGIRNWLWKGAGPTPTAEIELILDDPAHPPCDLNYQINFTERSQSLFVQSERFLDWPSHDVVFNIQGTGLEYREDRDGFRSYKVFDLEEYDNQRSILSQREEYYAFDISGIETKYLIRTLKSVRLYRDWRFGREALPRMSQFADLPNDFLEENCRNLANVLNRFFQKAKLKRGLLDYLSRFYEGAEDLTFLVQGGTVQMFLQEKSFEDATPATRLSDGTLRWLALLAILLNPDPPPLVCLEEPELGLHPDMMHVLAELLRDASKRMQLVVTTHSDALIDALTSTPEAVIVCEKVEGSTRMRRLNGDDLAVWLKEYSLGNLWRSGQIGGNRW